MSRKDKVTLLQKEHVAKQMIEATEDTLFHYTSQYNLSGGSVFACFQDTDFKDILKLNFKK